MAPWHAPLERAHNHGAYGRARGHKGATNGHKGAIRGPKGAERGHGRPGGRLGVPPRGPTGRARSVNMRRERSGPPEHGADACPPSAPGVAC